MDILSFQSADSKVSIQIATAADTGKLWRRFCARLNSEQEADTYCDYRSSLPGTLRLYDRKLYDCGIVGEPESTAWLGMPPVFYETASYNFSLRFSGIEGKPSVIHRLKEVAELFTAVDLGNGNWLLAAPLDFINEPGIFDLNFRYRPIGGAERTDVFEFRVVSPKLDAKKDYNYILSDINREYNEIVFQYLTKTFQNLTRGGRSDNDVVWLSIFRDVVEQYKKAVSYIVNRPHLREVHDVRFSRADHIKRWSPRMAEQYEEAKADKRLETTFFRHEISENTANTPENRFVKFTLDRISRRLDAIYRRISTNANRKGSEVSESELAELDSYRRDLLRLSNSSLLRKLHGEPLRSESLVLQKRTGYSQVYRYWLMLQKGIELWEGSNNIGVRPVWELYELWCFLKMRQMVADILGLHFGNPEEIVEVPMVMIEPFSDSTAEHTVRFFPTSGDEVRLHYQHTYNRKSGEVHTATTDNRPDIVLSIRKPDGMELTYLYDAKYRVTDDDRLSADDAAETATLGTAADYPPSDAINQMHRYRDAIYYGEHTDRHGISAKEIIGGYILFPGRGTDEAVRKRYYFKSIEAVNIGAFPLLPDHNNPHGEGSLLREHLENILLSQTAYEQIKDSIPQRGLVYTRAVADSNDLILVGYYKSEEQLQAITANKLYYVPAGLGKGSINLVSGFEATKYLLLHHGNERKLLELTGEGPQFFPATQLREMGFDPTGQFYLGFRIKSLNEIVIDDFDVKDLNLISKGKLSFRPYFTTFKQLKEK